jgi:hypothetical protein
VSGAGWCRNSSVREKPFVKVIFAKVDQVADGLRENNQQKLGPYFRAAGKWMQSMQPAADMLGLYQTELARILGLQCGGIGRLARAQWCLESGTPAWSQAVLLVCCYRTMYEHCRGDGVAMVHWQRVEQPVPDATPRRLMVDEGRLADVVDLLAH